MHLICTLICNFRVTHLSGSSWTGRDSASRAVSWDVPYCRSRWMSRQLLPCWWALIYFSLSSTMLKTNPTNGVCLLSESIKSILPSKSIGCFKLLTYYARTDEDWQQLLPWNIEITPFKMRGEWVEWFRLELTDTFQG